MWVQKNKIEAHGVRQRGPQPGSGSQSIHKKEQINMEVSSRWFQYSILRGLMNFF